MVITPFTPHGINVRIPENLDQELPDQFKSLTQGIVVSLNNDGTILINRDPVTYETLGQQLQKIYSARADKSLFIKGGKDLMYTDIVTAVDIAKGAGVEEIGLMTEIE